jgi:aminoglycoside N3'-acetyltransferase
MFAWSVHHSQCFVEWLCLRGHKVLTTYLKHVEDVVLNEFTLFLKLPLRGRQRAPVL